MNLEALKELAAKVEAEEFDFDNHTSYIRNFREFSRAAEYAFGRDYRPAENVFSAYHGSLDSAKALHDAVLPGWNWSIANDIEGVIAAVWPNILPVPAKFTGVAFVESEARAWFLAILRALIAQEESK